jgi:hypothetical protein
MDMDTIITIMTILMKILKMDTIIIYKTMMIPPKFCIFSQDQPLKPLSIQQQLEVNATTITTVFQLTSMTTAVKKKI